MANTTEDTDLILEAALKDAFSALTPSSRPQSLKPIPKPEPVSDESTTATTTTTTSQEEGEESVDTVAPTTETQTDAEITTTTTTTTTDTTSETPNVEVEVPQEQEQVEESTKDTDGDTWKSEYEEQVKAWRAQSAEAREKAEKVREQWEAVRAAEREEAERRKAAGIVDEVVEVVEKIVEVEVEVEVTSSPVEVVEENKTVENVEEKEEVVQEEGVIIDIDDSPSPPDARDEPEGQYTVESSVMLSRVQSRVETETSSQKWEEINSSETSSSYPSLSFPERILTPSPFNDSHSHQHHHQEQVPTAATTATVGGGIIEPQTTTLAIFDSSLSTSTRLKALASSLSINLLLPFINGVMLGFGEIFAKNVVMKWFGWGSTVANVGLSSSRQQRSFNNPRF